MTMQGRLVDDNKGGVSFKQPKKTIYVKSPKELETEIFAKLSVSVGSPSGLQNLFEKLQIAMTNRMNKPIDGKPAPTGDQLINYEDVYFLIFNKLRSTDSPMILTDEALKLFFDATNEIHCVSTLDKNAPINAGALEMQEEDKAMQSLLDTFTSNASPEIQKALQEDGGKI